MYRGKWEPQNRGQLSVTPNQRGKGLRKRLFAIIVQFRRPQPYGRLEQAIVFNRRERINPLRKTGTPDSGMHKCIPCERLRAADEFVGTDAPYSPLISILSSHEKQPPYPGMG